MKAIKVNADYESVLFQNKQLPVVNEALEPLALFLSTSPIISSKKYSSEFLDYVEEKTGRRPELKKEGSFENWWGPLTDIELEKKLNSKEMSAELMIQQGWCKDTLIISSLDELPNLEGKIYLAKNPYGMSGQNFCRVEEGRVELLERLLKNGKAIVEPLFNRIHDFSHYVFPNGQKICYQNVVDQKFQYRGTVFQNYTQPTPQQLAFYNDVPVHQWKRLENHIETIIAHYEDHSLSCGFSIDSFVYDDNGSKIRSLSEVNYRRTMGQTAFELALKFGGLRSWNALFLTKSSGLSFQDLRMKIKDIEWESDLSRGVVILSPGDTRYDMFLLSALDRNEGQQLLAEFQNCLPQSEIDHFIRMK